MKKFAFRVILAELSQASEGLAHALYDAGCTDTSVSSSNGVVAVRFRRQSDSLDAALLGARDQVESAGYRVERVELTCDHLDALESERGASLSSRDWQ